MKCLAVQGFWEKYYPARGGDFFQNRRLDLAKAKNTKLTLPAKGIRDAELVYFFEDILID